MKATCVAATVLAVMLGPACAPSRGQASSTAGPLGQQGEEFVGPFASWANVKTDYGAVGDGVADDTNAIQRALTELGTPGHSPVLFVPAGTYRITRTLTWLSGLNASIVGEDPDRTIFVWDGDARGTMIDINGLSYSRLVRLTFDGRRRASVAVEQSWDNKRPTFDTGNEYADDRFIDVEYGIRGGFRGAGFAETSVVRARFVRNTRAGIALGNFNALDLWVWDSLFDHCGTGVTNGTGAGNFHIYDSVFLQSRVSDLAMGNTGGFSARGNYSSGSRAFFVSTVTKIYPATVHLQRNTILDPTGSFVIDLRNQGPGLLTDNVVRSLPEASGPIVQWFTLGGADVVSIGNTFTVGEPIRTNGRLVTIGDRQVARDALDVPKSSLPDPPRSLSRPVIDVPARASRADIQRAIDRASSQNGNRPIVHLPSGVYSIDDTLVVPAGDVQIVGDGYGTILRWSGSSGGPLVKVLGPSKATFRELQLDGAGRVDSLSAEAIDQSAAHIYLDQVQMRSGTSSNLFVDGLNNAAIELRDAGYAGSQGASIKAAGQAEVSIFSGASSNNKLTYDVSGGASVLVRDVWYESSSIPGFARVHEAGTFTLDGARVATPLDAGQPAVQVEGLQGDVAILSTDFDGSLVVSGEGSQTRVLGLAMVDEQPRTRYLVNAAAPPARMLLANSRQRRPDGPGNRSEATQNLGAVDSQFVEELLGPTRDAMPQALRSRPGGATDLRLFRVVLSNGLNNLRLQP